jgi:iron complex transport system permease protein
MQGVSDDYREYIWRKVLFIALIAIVVALMVFVSISAGSAHLSVQDVILTLFGYGSEQSKIVVLNIRLPRVITALIGGVGLAVTGCALQSILKNPLASASTLGISQGAAFGASFAIIVLSAGLQGQSGDAVTFTNSYLISICAFVGASISTMFVLGLSRAIKVTPEAMILTGVALSALFAGATTLLQYFADDTRIAAVMFWTFGDLGRTTWHEVWIMSMVTFLALGYFLLNRWNYNALNSGEDIAKGLGVNVDRTRLVGMLVCSVTASTIVSFVGIINFIGLIAPHLVRRVIGSDYRFVLPASALVGAFLLLGSDLFARLAISPVILPIGAITSFLGAPMFLYLLIRGMNR